MSRRQKATKAVGKAPPDSEKKAQGRRLALAFVSDEIPELDRVEFRYKKESELVSLRRDEADKNKSFLWTAAPQALSLLFLDYVIWGRTKTNQTFSFPKPKEKRLAISLGDDRYKDIGILRKLFVDLQKGGEASEQIHNVLKIKLARGTTRPTGIILKTDFLPFDCVELFWDYRGTEPLTELSDFLELAKRIRNPLGLAREEEELNKAAGDDLLRTPTTPGPQQAFGANPDANQPQVPSDSIAVTRFSNNIGPLKIEPALRVLVSESEFRTVKAEALPASIKTPVRELSECSSRGLQLNLLIRWALNRRGGLVILQGGEYPVLFSSLIEAERLFRDAILKNEGHELISPRLWLAIKDLPSSRQAKGAWLTELLDSGEVSRDQRAQLQSRDAKLGIMFRVSEAFATPEGMREVVACVVGLIEESSSLEPLFVFHTTNISIATGLSAALTPFHTSAEGLPLEILEVVPMHGRVPALSNISAWNLPLAPGVALLRACQQMDPDGKLLRRKEFRALWEALGKFNRSGAALGEDPHGSMPHPDDIVEDFAHIDRNEIGAVRSFLALTKSYERWRAILASMVATMAGKKPAMRLAALEAAVPDFDLVEAWLEGLGRETRLAIPFWWANANARHLESVLAALIRQAKCGNDESRRIAEEWLPSLSPRLRDTAKFALHSCDDLEKAFGESKEPKSLLFLGECNPSMEIPVDEVSTIFLNKPEFWQLVQRLPLTIDLVQRLARLPAEFRAVVGLCPAADWITLQNEHALPKVFDRRGYLSAHQADK